MGTNIRAEVSEKNTYWLPKHRYYELKHFCMQYPEWKYMYAFVDGYPNNVARIWVEIQSSEVGDPTEKYAEARIYYADRIRMVEESAAKAAGDMGPLMVRAVTEGLSYDKISPPCCKEVWYAAYRRFFWLLDKARK